MPNAAPLEWDTRFFGLAVGRLASGPGPSRAAELDESLAAARDSGFACLYFEAPFEAATAALCSRPGFALVDLKTTLSKHLDAALAAAGEPDPGVSDRVRDDDLPALERIAEQISLVSRFAVDPRFGAGEAARLYREWLRRSVFDGYASDVLVLDDGPGPAGLLTLREKDGGPRIDLFGVDAAGRGRGAGRRLLAAAERRAASRGARRLSVVTQGHNTGALRIYEKDGFRIESLNLFYHIWLDRLP